MSLPSRIEGRAFDQFSYDRQMWRVFLIKEYYVMKRG
jgi:hypothetical protein